MLNIDLIRAAYNIEDIVPGLRGSGNKWGICPLPQHRHSLKPTPSFSVYWGTVKGVKRQFWKCHGYCKQYGDVIDLAGFLWVPGYDKSKRMRVEAAYILSGQMYRINPPVAPPPLPKLPQWLAGDMLPPSRAVVNYAISRGLIEEQIYQYKVGTPRKWMKNKPYNVQIPAHWMSIPIFHHDQLISIKLRKITKSGLRYMAVLGSKRGLWGYNDAWLTTKPVLVMKGEICAMVARRFGFLSVAPTAGEGGDVSDVRNALALAPIIVVGDNDKVGHKSGEKRAAFLGGILRFPPDPYTGWDDWILEKPEEAKEITERWIMELGHETGRKVI